MNKQQLLDTLEKMNMRPGRGLGQNFLQDNNLLEFIVRSADIQPGDVILEAGPGFGALSRLLLGKGAEVFAIEYDHRLADYLKKEIKSDRFHLLEADACKADIVGLMPVGKPFYSIANLPYSISSVFVARLLELERPPEKMVFMLQKEMGQRLSAVPGIKNYGSLSVRTQVLYDVKLLRVVPPEVFFPQPKVESAIVSFELRKEQPEALVKKYLPGVVRTAFGQRRKQLGKVLGMVYGRDRANEVLAQLGFSPEVRPDKLSVTDFIALTKALFMEEGRGDV